MTDFIEVPYFNIKNNNININQRMKGPIVKNHIIRGIRIIKKENFSDRGTKRNIVRTTNRNI
jgi:hypothetical protein